MLPSSDERDVVDAVEHVLALALLERPLLELGLERAVAAVVLAVGDDVEKRFAGDARCHCDVVRIDRRAHEAVFEAVEIDAVVDLARRGFGFSFFSSPSFRLVGILVLLVVLRRRCRCAARTGSSTSLRSVEREDRRYCGSRRNSTRCSRSAASTRGRRGNRGTCRPARTPASTHRNSHRRCARSCPRRDRARRAASCCVSLSVMRIGEVVAARRPGIVAPRDRRIVGDHRRGAAARTRRCAGGCRCRQRRCARRPATSAARTGGRNLRW